MAEVNVHCLTQKQLAELFGVTPRSIRDWHSEGLPRLESGNYDGAECVAWYANDDGVDQRDRLAAAQAEKAEAENAIRRGELADTNAVSAMWSEMIAAARAKLLSLPTKLSSQIANVSDVGAIAAIIRTEVYAALAELAVPQQGANEGAGNVETAVDHDGQRVGRRKKAPEQRVKRGARTVAN
jgi:phage terminase Nu1 subunit (DNA packaging protein)